jgi:hypothetical protein
LWREFTIDLEFYSIQYALCLYHRFYPVMHRTLKDGLLDAFIQYNSTTRVMGEMLSDSVVQQRCEDAMRTSDYINHIMDFTQVSHINPDTLTAPFLLLHSLGGHPYRPAYLPNFDKRSLTISKCMSIGAHCIPHCKIMVGKERPAALNQTVMHIGCNRS